MDNNEYYTTHSTNDVIINYDTKIEDYKNISKHQFETYRVRVTRYEHFIVNNVKSNCKLWTVDHIIHTLEANKEQTLNKLDGFFNNISKQLAFTVNVNNDRYIEMLQERFNLIGISKIPIGYHAGYQYHATFMTNYTDYNGYSNYKKRCEKEIEIPEKYKKNNSFSTIKFNEIFNKKEVVKKVTRINLENVIKF